MTTTHLLMTAPYPSTLRAATQPPFLRAAGRGLVPKPLLAAYLSQDRLYQHAYVRLVAQLLSKVRFDSPASSSATSSSSSSLSDQLARKVMNALIDALIGIRKELEFFEHVADKYGFGLTTPMPPSSSSSGDEGPTPITRAYIDFFTSVSGPGASMLEGLVALWATEKCYLEAWCWAASFVPTTSASASEDRAASASAYTSDADGGAIRSELMPSWTNAAFGEVVTAMGELVDEVAAAETQRLGAEVVERRCVEVWRQVLWLEERFWPVLEGDSAD
jgi:thiaminase